MKSRRAKGKPEAPAALIFDGDRLRVLDQRLLPKKIAYLECTTTRRAAAAIRKMAVRGAPAIGLCGAYGMALAARRNAHRSSHVLLERLRSAASELSAARPTAADLARAVDRVLHSAESADESSIVESVIGEAEKIRKETDAACRAIAKSASDLLAGARRILTYCNTGSLATGVSTGTALGAIEYRARAGGSLEVWVPETRPYYQGSRLTAFELICLDIPFSIVTDATCGYLLATGQVDAVIVGADRIAANGDTANKIGTYAIAALAQRHGVPFYVAAPSSSFDLSAASGADIPIEVRGGEEVIEAAWKTKAARPGLPKAYYPAFDVTPNDLIAAIVCEFGVLRPPFEKSIRRAIGD